eukprot:SRR837773.13481.p1 GENE.SRR837773.13481~~SRR837773.13481.p1  ORF type:complete len:217 (+),score=55.47 SRR837773.13481:60-710(+)
MALSPSRVTGNFTLAAWHRFHRRLRKKTSAAALGDAAAGTDADPGAGSQAAAPGGHEGADELRTLALRRHNSTSPLNLGPDGSCQEAARAEFLRGELVCKNERKVEDEYLFEDCLGEGSFGKVHKAVHIHSGVHRAIKELPKLETLAEEFELELQALIELDHPHIVQVIEHFEATDRYFIVMELCTGPDLFSYIVDQTKVDGDPERRSSFRRAPSP